MSSVDTKDLRELMERMRCWANAAQNIGAERAFHDCAGVVHQSIQAAEAAEPDEATARDAIREMVRLDRAHDEAVVVRGTAESWFDDYGTNTNQLAIAKAKIAEEAVWVKLLEHERAMWSLVGEDWDGEVGL